MARAPRARSFHGWGRQGADPVKMQDVVRWQNEQSSGVRGQFVLANSTGSASQGYQEEAIEVWFDDGRWRVQKGDRVSIGGEDRVLSWAPGHGGTIHQVAPGSVLTMDGLGGFFASMNLAGFFRFEVARITEVAGRPAWQVSASSVDGARGGPPVFVIGGDTVEMAVDQETGIVLKCQGQFRGDLVTSFELTELTVDCELDPSLFSFATPDGSRILSPDERLLEVLSRRGVDTSGIDPTDHRSVQEAMQIAMPGPRAVSTLEELAGQHIPTGPPPNDQAVARRQIEHAFEHIGERSEDGTGLIHVQLGSDLGSCADEIARRFPSINTASIPVEHIKFMSQIEAVVWLRSPAGAPREGRAILTDDGWKVSRATYCSLIRTGGVRCPPPP